jgi:hypothetical protein
MINIGTGCLEPLVSRKCGNCEVTSEESETTKLGIHPSATLITGQAEIACRGIFIGSQAHHCNAARTPKRVSK